MNIQPILEEFEHRNLKAGRYLLAFSGGPDSVFLLYMLKEYFREDLKEHIDVCYINYHDSPFVDQEEKLVHEMISSFGLRLFQYDTQFDKTVDKNFEDWARTYRYSLFRDIIQAEKLDGLLTAHQLSDSIETYILQKERGNLPLCYGLPKETTLNGIVVYRPILSVTKEELTQYLVFKGIPFYDDITNYDDHTKRNRIRKKESSSLFQHQLQKEIDQENRKLEMLYASFQKLVYPIQRTYYDSLSEEEKRRLVFYLVRKEKMNVSSKREAGISKEAYEFLKGHSSSRMKLDESRILYRNGSNFFIDSPHEKAYCYTFSHPGIYKTEEFEIDLKDPSVFNQMTFPLTIRSVKEDDRFSTDLKPNSVLCFLKKQQVPSHLIPIYPVFVCNGKIRYVPFFSDIKKRSIPFAFRLLY